MLEAKASPLFISRNRNAMVSSMRERQSALRLNCHTLVISSSSIALSLSIFSKCGISQRSSLQ
jgi:hypothetical protein